MLSGQHEVVTVSSGEEGQSLLSVDQRFDLILCDLMMPRVSGVDLHQWLTEYHPELAAQVVFVSGGAFTPQAKAYLGKVSNHQIEKPFRTRELLDFVQSMIR